MKIGKPELSLQWKITAAFVAVDCFVAVFVGVAIAIHVDTIEGAAKLEAEHVARLIADGATENDAFRPRLQDYVASLNSVAKRDILIVDAGKLGLAGMESEEIGKKYHDDPGDEVGKTISDGQTRVFIETNERHPEGADQIVVPVWRNASYLNRAPIGAINLEYTSIRKELFISVLKDMYLIVAAGIVAVLLVTLFGLDMAKRIGQPLRDLKSSVESIAAQDYAARVTVSSRDEIGLLGSAFNRMAEDICTSHAALVEQQRGLERRVAERTRELDESNTLLRQEARERQLAAERVDYLAYYDVLTGLANRSLFLERVAWYVRSAVSDGHKLAVFLIDLERFKNINDSLGRPAGDALLRQVAEWLTRKLGDVTLLARVGADHFAAVLPRVNQDGDLARLPEKWSAAFLEHPFRLNDAVFRIAAKVGVAVFPDDGADADTLFRNAEAALKQAKVRGERYLFHTRKMTEAVAGKLTLENQLRHALEQEQFVLHYQPKVNLASGKVTSAEALMRWNDPRTGLVPPGRFIPVLEETGLIFEVGRWALRQSIKDYLRWRAAGLPAVRIAVNVSPLQLRQRGFIDEVRQVVGIDAQAEAGLELELTESVIMEDIKHNIASLQAIRAMGVTIAIDDFGTGFSSLSYLARLPVDTLKIDRSFVIDMTLSPEGLALVSTIIGLAHSLKLKVVAEGVETEQQSRLLHLLNCDEMQGFLFSKPVPAELFEANFLAPTRGA